MGFSFSRLHARCGLSQGLRDVTTTNTAEPDTARYKKARLQREVNLGPWTIRGQETILLNLNISSTPANTINQVKLLGITLPLDKICLRSGILCASCQRKVDEGVISREELSVLKALAEVEAGLKDFEGRYVRAIRYGGNLVILLEASTRIPRRLRKELASRLKDYGQILVARYGRDPEETINSLIEPSRIIGADEIYTPDGSRYKVLKIDKKDQHTVAKIEEALKEIARKIYGVEILIEYVASKERKPKISMEKRDIRSSLEKLGL